MIIRIFRVRIHPELRQAFERDFIKISAAIVEKATGCESLLLGSPTEAAPNEYTMITKWRDWNSLIAFTGSEWDEPSIPDQMQKYADSSQVHHYEEMPIA